MEARLTSNQKVEGSSPFVCSPRFCWFLQKFNFTMDGQSQPSAPDNILSPTKLKQPSKMNTSLFTSSLLPRPSRVDKPSIHNDDNASGSICDQENLLSPQFKRRKTEEQQKPAEQPTSKKDPAFQRIKAAHSTSDPRADAASLSDLISTNTVKIGVKKNDISASSSSMAMRSSLADKKTESTQLSLLSRKNKRPKWDTKVQNILNIYLFGFFRVSWKMLWKIFKRTKESIP